LEGLKEKFSSLRGKFSNFLARVVSAVFLVLAIVLLLWWGDIPFLVGMTVIIALGLWEFYRLLGNHGYSPAMFLALPVGIALPIVSFFLKDKPQDLAPLTALLCGFLALTFLWYVMRPGQPNAVASIALTFLGVFLISFTLSHFVLMLRFDDIHWTVPFTIIVMTWVYDAIAYFAGSAFGKHKLSPKVSPNKSWEGLIAGTLATFIAAFILKITVSRDWLSFGVAFTLAAIVSLAGPLGDLSESLIKRELDVKDMSELIPGHGGILDRFDSMLFTAVIAYYYLRFVIKL
jgi:phosphatidate cytidylyltransferase